MSVIPFKERVIGEALTAGSAVGKRFKNTAALVGEASSESYIAARWRLARHMSADMVAGWMEYEGNDSAGKTPRNYPEAVIFNFDRAYIDRHIELNGGQKAVAYVLGEAAVMVGTADDQEIFTPDPEMDNFYQVAMRIGKGTLRAMPGVRTPAGDFVQPVESGLVTERLELARVPAHIPIV